VAIPKGDPAHLQNEANRIVRDWNALGSRMSHGAAARGAAIFAPLLALIGPLMCIPATAHALGEPHVQPIAMLGTLFFGTFGYTAIQRVREHSWALKYLSGQPG
jgi:hypothetical protein